MNISTPFFAIIPSVWVLLAFFGTPKVDNTPAKQSQIVNAGETLQTGLADFVLGKLPALGVFSNTYPSSELSLLSVHSNQTGGYRAVWELKKGITDFKVPHLYNSTMEIYLKRGKATIKGTQFTARYNQGLSTVGVKIGSVTLTNNGKEVTIPRDYYSQIHLDSDPIQPVKADKELKLFVAEKESGDKWRVYVAPGNTILFDNVLQTGQTTTMKVNDYCTVINPLGDTQRYKLVLEDS